MPEGFENWLAAELKREAASHTVTLSADELWERRQSPVSQPSMFGLLALGLSTAAIAGLTVAVFIGLGGLRMTNPPVAAAPSTDRTATAVPAVLVPIKTQDPRPPGTTCAAARTAGVLVAHLEDGVAVRQGSELLRVVWPNGWVARRADDGLELLDNRGVVQAREGDSVVLSGGQRPDGYWSTCGGGLIDDRIEE